MEKKDRERIIELIHSEVKPALGCTEPGAVALAVAAAAEKLRETGVEPDRISVEVSPNIMKNGMGVGIPGTNAVGLKMATALSCVCGKSSYGLEVLKDVTPEAERRAEAMLDDVTVRLADNGILLYIRAICNGSSKKDGTEHESKAVIEYSHDSIVLIERDGEVLFATEDSSRTSTAKKEERPYTPDMITLWTIAAFFKQSGKSHWLSSIPAMFITVVCISYLFIAPHKVGGLALNPTIGYCVGGVASIAFLILLLTDKRTISR